MSLLNQLWDDTVAGPPPENGLGKLRKFSTFNFRPNSGKESEGQNPNPNTRSLTVDTSDDAIKVTRSIMILKSPRNQNKDSPPASPSPSPAGSTPPVSPFSDSSSSRFNSVPPPRLRQPALRLNSASRRRTSSSRRRAAASRRRSQVRDTALPSGAGGREAYRFRRRSASFAYENARGIGPRNAPPPYDV